MPCLSQNFIDINKYTSPVVLSTFNWNNIHFITNVVLTLVLFITHLKLKVRAGADLRWDTLFSGPGGLRTPDTGWGGWILASLTHTSCCHSDPGWVSASHWSVESSPGSPMARHWSPQATRTSDTRLRDNWQKTRLWNRSLSKQEAAAWQMKVTLYCCCLFTIDIHMDCWMLALLKLPWYWTGAERAPGWNCWASLDWAHWTQVSSLSRLWVGVTSSHSILCQ